MKRSTILVLVIAVIGSVIAIFYCHTILSRRNQLESHRPPLHLAVGDGDMQEIKRLIEAGADVNQIAIGLISSRDSKSTPLCVAVNYAQKDIAELLIAHGADVNLCYPLGIAASKNRFDIAVLLLDNGADLYGDGAGNFSGALISASERGHVEMVKLLIDRGVDLKAKPKDQFSSPMCQAAQWGHTEIVALLISKGVDVNLPRTRGSRTPLHQAAISGHADIVKLLVAQGAELNRKDEDGKTALDLAKEFGYPSVVEVLRKHGAKE